MKQRRQVHYTEHNARVVSDYLFRGCRRHELAYCGHDAARAMTAPVGAQSPHGSPLSRKVDPPSLIPKCGRQKPSKIQLSTQM